MILGIIDKGTIEGKKISKVIYPNAIGEFDIWLVFCKYCGLLCLDYGHREEDSPCDECWDKHTKSVETSSNLISIKSYFDYIDNG